MGEHSRPLTSKELHEELDKAVDALGITLGIVLPDILRNPPVTVTGASGTLAAIAQHQAGMADGTIPHRLAPVLLAALSRGIEIWREHAEHLGGFDSH